MGIIIADGREARKREEIKDKRKLDNGQGIIRVNPQTMVHVARASNSSMNVVL
jgi:hypothetical protein